MSKEFLRTSDLNRPRDGAGIEPGVPGPSTADEGISDSDFCVRFAYPEEWERFRAEIEKRKAGEPKERFLKCDKCDFKIATEWRRDRTFIGEACLRCNSGGYVDGGHLSEMSGREVKAWKETKAAREKILRERQDRARENAEQDNRRRAGLE